MDPIITNPASVFGKDYYDHMCEVPYDRDQPVWRKHFRTLAQTLVERYHPQTTMDVGCAKGFLVENLRDAGVDAFGMDVSPYAISQVRPDLRPYFQVSSGADSLAGKFDLITCIEVAEHMPEAVACKMIADLCQHSDQVIFSSTNEDYEEPTHVNMHPAEYWVDLFRQQGFFRDANFDPGFITPQAMRFLRGAKPTLRVAVFSHEPPSCAVALLRLAGIIQHLEKEKRMELQWCVARDPQLDIARLLENDIFVFQREFADRRFCRHVLAAIRELGKPIVFELDDLLINVPESNPNHKHCQSIAPDIMGMLREADFVTVTTEPLKRYLAEAEPQARDKTFVLPNYVNLDIWDGATPPPDQAREPFVIGWFGTATHDEDLAIIKPAIVHLARKYAGKLVFKFWGYLPKDLAGIPGVELVRGSQPNLRLHARDLVNCHIDLALAPLSDHPFNHAKSDLKWLEYSICYIPGIYSTISPYTNAVAHGRTGWLVDNQPELWVAAIETLMRDDRLRRQIAIQAHDEVRQTRCLDVGSEQWDALYRSFQVSGCKPKAPRQFSEAERRERATAHSLYFIAELQAGKGQREQAANTCDLAIRKWMRTEPVVDSIVGGALAHSRRALEELKTTADLNASLKAAEAVAQVDRPEAARRLYIATLQQAQETNDPAAVLRIILEVARAFRKLDPKTGAQLLEHGTTLAKSLRAEAELKTIAQLRLDYEKINAPKPAAARKQRDKHPQAPAKLPANPPAAAASPALVSIVIPVFNHLALTRNCLKSLYDHTPASLREIVVVDNGSTDGSAEFLKGEQAAGRIRVISNATNAGFAQACNQGAATRGKYVLFLNNDTEVKPGWLEALVQMAEADARVGAVGSKLLFPDGTIQHAGILVLDSRPAHDPLLAKHVFYREPADHPRANAPRIYQALTAASLLIRRDVFEQVGRFDEEYWNGYEDVDLCFKIQQAGYLLVYQPASVAVHHESQSGPERFRGVSRNIARLHQKWLGKVQPDFVVNDNQEVTQTAAGRIRNYSITPVVETGPVVSIIVLVRNQLEHTRICLDSIAAHTPLPHEVIVVDNGSTDGTPDFLKSWSLGNPGRIVVRNESNRGFAGGNNQGLALAQGKHVVLLNNDTAVTPGWLEAMLAVLDRNPETGMVGPVSNQVSGPQLVSGAAYKDLVEMQAFAARHVQANAGRSLLVGRAVGFCLLAKREVLEKIGGLDESFGTGNFEDDDWCIRAQLAGYHIRIACDSFVHHTGSRTFAGEKINYRASMQRNWEIFRVKWALPGSASLEGTYPIPRQLPSSVSLKLPLPTLTGTHQLDGRLWTEKPKACPPPVAVKPAPQPAPAVAKVGRLDEARALCGQKNYPAAWAAAATAIAHRPFHPEGFLLLAEIALAAGDAGSARRLAKQARDLAPEWEAPKRFLSKPLKGGAKLEWLNAAALLNRPATPRLSICLIVKNEERFLGQCLKSVRSLGAQIIVVDTGSTDRTVEIAREFGAEIYSFPWCDDFAAARNAALEHATGDWVLMLDADEELPEAQHAKLRKDMQDAKIIALRLSLVNAGQENQGRCVVPRLFRNMPEAYYTGRIHEQVFPSLLVGARKWGLHSGLGTAELLHHGYSKELVRDRNKIERNLKLLTAAIVENPTDVNLLINLGLELVRSDSLAAGIEKYREAYQRMSAQPVAEVVPELREVLLTQFTSHLYKIRGHEEIVQVLTSPLARLAGLTASLNFALGLAYFELKQFREAADQMRQCLAHRKQFGLTPINTDILTAAPQHCLALCLDREGDVPGAEKAFLAALEEPRSVEPAKLDYAKFLQLHDRPVEALQQLNAIVAANSQQFLAWRLGGEIALSRADFLAFALDWTAEAVKAMPENPALAAQRAEALMLTSQAAAALPLWEKLWRSEPQPRTLAALILCQIAAGQPAQTPGDELAASKAFVEWYQRLLSMRVKTLVDQINGQLEPLGHPLPTAAQMLRNALSETGVGAAV